MHHFPVCQYCEDENVLFQSNFECEKYMCTIDDKYYRNGEDAGLLCADGTKRVGRVEQEKDHRCTMVRKTGESCGLTYFEVCEDRTLL